jgi:hypothetical protein
LHVFNGNILAALSADVVVLLGEDRVTADFANGVKGHAAI